MNRQAAISVKELAPKRRFAPYSSYRDSCAEWLGAIPKHWGSKKLKWDSLVKRGASPRPIDDPKYFDDDGTFAWVRIADVTAAGMYLTQTTQKLSALGAGLSVKTLPGTLFLSIAGSVGKPCITKIRCCIHDGFVYFPNLSLEPRFLYYMFKSGEPYKGLGKLGTQLNLNTDIVGDIKIPVPSDEEQRAIAAFLDRETGRIDELISKKKRLIELLAEKRTALISHAVTKGLNPDAPMKDSGSPLWSRIPRGWSIKELRHLTPDQRRIMYGIVLPGPNVDDGVFIVKGHNCEPGRLAPEFLCRTTFEIESGYVRSRVHPGDIVYAIRGSIGAAEMVPMELEGANLTQDAARIAPRNDVHGRWLLYVVQSLPFFARLEAGAVGSAIKGINIRDLKRGVLPVPPPDEQRAIASFLDRETTRIDELVAKVHEAIDKLCEYRSALISAAVTGKIDVREVQT